MEERISEGDRNEAQIEYVAPGSQGELQPFVRPHTAHFVGMLMATEFRRNRARLAAVSYGTATASGIPLSSMSVIELAHYYNNLIWQAEIEEQSSELYEQFQEKKITVETLMLRLKEESDPEETKALLQELDKLAAEAAELAERMESM